MAGPEFYGRDDRGRQGRPLFLYLVYLVHGAWFAAQAFCQGAAAVRSVLDGSWFVPWLSGDGRSPYWFLMNLCICIAVVLVSGFAILAFAALWTWIYRKVRGCAIDRTHRPRQDVTWSRLPLGLKFALGYGIGFFLLACGGTVVYLYAFFAASFGDTTGAGPLVGVMFGPMLAVVLFMGCGAVGVLAACVVPGWFLSNRMLAYIAETLRYFTPSQDDPWR